MRQQFVRMPIPSSPACLCWRYLHRFCWWYNSAYILHSSLPLLQAVFNTAQDTLCQLKRVLNADKTKKFRLFTNSQTGQKREESDTRNHTRRALALHTACFSTSPRGLSASFIQLNKTLHAYKFILSWQRSKHVIAASDLNILHSPNRSPANSSFCKQS